jgi:hypothetical protein
MIEGIDFLAKGARGCLARGQLHPDMVNEWWTPGRFLRRSGLTAKARGWRIYGKTAPDTVAISSPNTPRNVVPIEG